MGIMWEDLDTMFQQDLLRFECTVRVASKICKRLSTENDCIMPDREGFTVLRVSYHLGYGL